MDEIPYFHNRRWYDAISHMTLAVHISRTLPLEVRQLIARNLNETIDESRKRSRNDKVAVSIGQQRVMGLYKAGRKQRWYDPEADLHRAFNFMSVIPELYLSEFAARILKIGHYIETQTSVLGYRGRRWEENTVESILQDKRINISESHGDIRLVHEVLTKSPKYKQPRRKES